MIDIKKGSAWYRLALYGTFFEDHKIQSNLCPFMRTVLLGFVLTIAYSFCAAVLIMTILMPPIEIFHYFYNGWLFEWNSAMAIGTGLWALAAVICLLVLYFAEDGSIARTFINEQLEKIDTPNLLIVQWIVALHQRICPQVTFEGSIKDGHLIKNKD